MIRNINRSQSILNSRLVFVVDGAILEGERDYSEQTLATPTLQRSHFLRGVVHMFLVRVKVKGVNSLCLSINQNSCLYVHQKLMLFYGVSSQSKRSRGDQVMFANGPLACV